MAVTQTIDVARTAVNRRAWRDALEAFHEVDQETPLSPQDLELLADAAWWSGNPDETVEVLERAFAAYVDQGSRLDAAGVAVLIAYLAARRNAESIVTGWVAHALRLLDGEPESAVHARLKVLEMMNVVFGQGDLKRASELAEETLVLARRVGSRDAESQALALKGAALIAGGEWKEGLSLLDEATAAAVSGSINLRAASDIYCMTIATCRSMADFGRAGQWTEEADRWMIRNSVTGYTGVCDVHRAELKRLHGNWTEAEEDARAACVELERYHILDGMGNAYYEIGEVRFRMGDLTAAEEAFMNAYENGASPHPGLALLMLARGEAADAAAALSGALKHVGSQNHLGRAGLLPAQVEVALALGDIETARAAIEELEVITSEFERPAFEAATLTAKGQLALQQGEAEEASDHLDRAWRRWKDIDFPYETARSRMLLGQARAAAGDQASARMELGAARSTFMRLGAAPDLRRVEELLYEARGAEAERSRVAKTLMFTDIVTSTDLVGVIGDAAWEDLLRWHDKELRSVFASNRGEVVNHTGDGFFAVFDRPSDAIDAAVAIQRRLAAHRRESGFALMVRIGIHQGEVTQEGADYRGQAVHAAARVGAAAGAEEIAVTAPVLEDAAGIRYPVSEARTVELKGIAEPVQVAMVDWR
jgi:class 3 adenylate cyclase